MLWKVDKELQTIVWENYQKECFHIAMISEDDYHKHGYKYFNLKDDIITSRREVTRFRASKIETYQTYYAGEVVMRSKKGDIKPTICYFYIAEHYFAVITDNDAVLLQYQALLMHQDIHKVTLERSIYLFLNEFIKDDIDELEEIQDDLVKLDDKILKEKIDNFVKLIENPKKQILSFDHYYDHLIVMGEELAENDIDLFTNTDYFKMYTRRVERLHNNTQMLKEYSMQIQEAYQSMMDMNLNNVMKLLTVLTAIFQPLTLIVGWYGMNFAKMPELTWEYGYLFVISLSFISLFICFFYFRKKKLL